MKWAVSMRKLKATVHYSYGENRHINQRSFTRAIGEIPTATEAQQIKRDAEHLVRATLAWEGIAMEGVSFKHVSLSLVEELF